MGTTEIVSMVKRFRKEKDKYHRAHILLDIQMMFDDEMNRIKTILIDGESKITRRIAEEREIARRDFETAAAQRDELVMKLHTLGQVLTKTQKELAEIKKANRSLRKTVKA